LHTYRDVHVDLRTLPARLRYRCYLLIYGTTAVDALRLPCACRALHLPVATVSVYVRLRSFVDLTLFGLRRLVTTPAFITRLVRSVLRSVTGYVPACNVYVTLTFV